MAELLTRVPASAASPPPALDDEIAALGHRLARGGSPLRRAQRAANDRAMALVARDPQVRAALFRLVDVAPACAGPAELAEHLSAFLAEVERPAVAVASRAAVAPGARWVAGRVATAAVRGMAGRFIVGETPAAAARTLRGLWARGSAVSVDLLGESTVTPAEGRHTRRAATRRSCGSPPTPRAGRRARCWRRTRSARCRA